MPRKINKIRDLEILSYLENHTYKETTEFFSISEMQISRIKKRNTPISQQSILKNTEGIERAHHDIKAISQQAQAITDKYSQKRQSLKDNCPSLYKLSFSLDHLTTLSGIELMVLYKSKTGKSIRAKKHIILRKLTHLAKEGSV